MTAPTNAIALQGMYYNQHWPLSLVSLLQSLIDAQQTDPNTPASNAYPVVRMWISQPRTSTDPTGEVLTIKFKIPLSIGEFSIDVLRTSCSFEVWYQDRTNNWIPMRDENYQPMVLNLSTSATVDWFTWHVYTYPIVAKAVQFRLTRRADPAIGNQPYPVGLRSGLVRRNVYDRSSGMQAMEDEQDSLGNVLTKYIQDWDAMGAVDDDPNTFWRSAPQPDPAAVVCLYTNFSNPDGSATPLDGIAIDPVYANQNLNLYYSTDDTVGTLKLSPIGIPPDTNENTTWTAGTGRAHTSDPKGVSIYQIPMAYGPLINRDAWIGVEWKPDFSPTPSSAQQFISISGSVTGGTFPLSLDGVTWTSDIPYNATGPDVQTALEALPDIGTGNVSVTGAAGGPWTVNFIGALAGQAVNALSYNSDSLVGTSIVMNVHTTVVGGVGGGPPNNPVLLQVSPGMDAVQVIAIDGDASGGEFQLSLDKVNYTSNLGPNATGADLQSALEALSAIGAGNVLVVGDPGGPWSATFQNALAQQAVPTLSAVSSLTGSTPAPVVTVRTTTTGSPPPNPGGAQYWPKLYYDVGAGEIVLELTNGVDAQTYSVPLSPALVQNVPIRVVAGWSYPKPIVSPYTTPLPAVITGVTSTGATDDASVTQRASTGATDDALIQDLGSPQPTVFLSVVSSDGTQLGALTTPAVDLPSQMSFDGEVGYYNFRGTMTATVIKLENWSAGQGAFQANPAMYVNPNPVVPDPNTGIIPSTTLDNAIYAVDWTLQNMGCGGGDASAYESKAWTPIFSNYVTQKGKLYFPQRVMLKYLKLEFSNLTEESYPVYDSGIQVMYQVFPVSVTQQLTPSNNASPLAVVKGLLGQTGGGGTASVNWLNAASVNNAISSVFGSTVHPIVVQTGPGTTTTSLPNQLGSTSTDTTVEASTQAVYRRQLPNTAVLASQQIKTFGSGGKGQPDQLTQTSQNIVNGITSQFTPIISFSPTPTSLPLQGNDFWLVPGQTAVVAANVMEGLTQGTSVQLNRKTTTEYRLRFTATGVHQYQMKTAVRDAAIAYFAGIREITGFLTSYIAGQDPTQFVFSPYDPNQFVFNNINQLPTGPLTTAGVTYQIQNPLFDTTLDNWDQAQGSWSVDPGMGRYQYGAATVVADGTEKILLSKPLTVWPAVIPGANFKVTIWCQWSGVTSTGEPAVLAANYYDSDGTLLSQQTASIAATGTNMWATEGQGGAQITLNGTVPLGCSVIKVAPEVTPDATAGQFWFDTVKPSSTDPVEGTTFTDIITQSTFVKVDCTFNDSGLVRSDDMWAALDPADTNISQTQLAWYTTTIPSQIPSGSWGDTVATWGDSTITWGEPFSEVSITIDPNMTFGGKRVLHFTRAAGAEEAGIAVRQVTNFVPNGMFRIGVIFYKPVGNTNQITVRLRRVSDGVYVYEESFTPQALPGGIGSFYEYRTPFQEIPDTDDQIYTLECVLFGDEADDLYINDLYCDIAQIRYFMRLGGSDQFLHDVTELAYTDRAIVSTTTPVNEVSIQSMILSPTAWQYSAVLVPNYLK